MSEYEEVSGLGDTITCDMCNNIAENWFTGDSRAICQACYSEMPMSWGEVANLTHAKQVARFNWCACEEQEDFPYLDCPNNPSYVAYCLDCDTQLGEDSIKTHDCHNDNICEDCDAVIQLSIEPYGTGQMLVYNCPNCGESYDTNYDGSEK